MPYLICRCGTRIDYGQIPAPLGFGLISEDRFDEIQTAFVQGLAKGDPFDEIANSFVETYRCPTCSRMIVFWSGRRGGATFYRKEE